MNIYFILAISIFAVVFGVFGGLKRWIRPSESIIGIICGIALFIVLLWRIFQ